MIPCVKIPFVIWQDVGGKFRIVCTSIAQGRADFAFEIDSGADSMGQQQWERSDNARGNLRSENLMNCLAYELLAQKYPDWRSIQ